MEQSIGVKESMSEYSISARNLVLTYKHIKQVTVKQWMVNLVRIKSSQKKMQKFQALKGVNFDIQKGKTVGIIGKNGSGKTTLLRVLAGIYSPDSGEVEINAKSVSLLALGVGFDNALTGYANIYLSALLRGYTKKETDERLKQIIDFAEIQNFINEPVKTYSSGMRARLAFAIAVHFDPEILLVDEVLSVGDEQFKIKSFDRMRQLISDKSHTVVIVSHNLKQLTEICDEVIWLDSGLIKTIGDPKEVIDQYVEYYK